MTKQQRIRRWHVLGIVSTVVLAVAFILLFYSLTALNACLEKTISDISVSQGLCTIPGLKSATSYNSVVVVLILVSSGGLLGSIRKIDRISREIQAEEAEEPPVEVRNDDAYLPDVADRTFGHGPKER